MTISIRRSVWIISLSLICMQICSCSFWQNRVELNTVTIDTAPDANDTTPVAVDIVAIADASLLADIQSLSAAQWFNAKGQLLRDAPDGLRVWSLELVPDSHFVAEDNPLRGAPAQAIVLFARYRSEGDHRLRIDTLESLHLLLMTDEATLAPAQGR